ncbi:hypothetical protein IFM89_019666 [Coptis chinensis]|uniref:TF-B3 domain-containing protein n=1 Tax=Coptis chinensis TaxID=261450 RepID=A0A835I3Q6_9MAGN|nr:hypothetical protein IFM89_019666 [Coptis chinensis]
MKNNSINNNINMHVHANEEEINEEEGLKNVMDSSDLNPIINDKSVNLNWEEDLDKELWFQRDHQNEDLLDVQNAFINYDDFPPLPDFPCISSSSSSSCSSAPVLTNNNNPNNKTSSSSRASSSSATSSSATSWVHKDRQQHQQQMEAADQALLSTGSIEIPCDEGLDRVGSDDYMDVMQELGGMDLLDSEDVWDPSTLFPCDGLEDIVGFDSNQHKEEGAQTAAAATEKSEEDDRQQEKPSEDLAIVFFEWLKSNKELISAEDLRSIRFKKATIDCAIQRLGGGKEGMEQLTKLILEWVQNHQLQRKRKKEADQKSSFPSQLQQNLNPNPTPDINTNPYLVPPVPQWLPHHQPYIPDSAQVFPPMMYGYMGEPAVYNNGTIPVSPTSFNNQPLMPPNWPPPPSHQYPPPAPYNPFPEQSLHPPPHLGPALQPRAFTPFANPYTCGLYSSPGDRIVRLGSSATKEARKKRMARQKRFFSHSRSHNQQHQQVNETRVANDTNCTTSSLASQHPNWLYWPSSSSTFASPSSMVAASEAIPQPPQGDRQTMQPQQYQRQVATDRRQDMHVIWFELGHYLFQGSKTGPEKNLKFLLQKVLKQSDVGNLGRIVLPKKEAETYLPGLEARDGISIAMEDIGTSRIWNMRYRFWPNNKSRMYLLENTGEFVRSNELQEGDFIVIYSDVKCGKYLIRGVKVRQPGLKSEAKKQVKGQRNLHSNSTIAIGSSSSSTKETVR